MGMHELVDSPWAQAISRPQGAVPVKGHMQGFNDARLEGGSSAGQISYQSWRAGLSSSVWKRSCRARGPPGHSPVAAHCLGVLSAAHARTGVTGGSRHTHVGAS